MSRSPDLAIAPRDVRVETSGERRKIQVKVHNIGSAPAGDFQVALQVRDGDHWQDWDVCTIPGLEDPLDWQPQTASASLSGPADDQEAKARIVIDSHQEVDEVNEGNNVVELAQAQQGMTG